MSVELKVKSKHLSEEARIIRFEEKRELNKARRNMKVLIENGLNSHQAEWEKQLSKFNQLNHHRRWDVRNENRATFLARAYLDGKPYSSVERNRKTEKEWVFTCRIVPRIVKMVNKYKKAGTEKVTDKDIIEWTKT